ncbi:hypothetical protein N7540_011074 [Penicillium herquei]|nr:hypothetical protein N7540_011074 [Penicillium herquei]
MLESLCKEQKADSQLAYHLSLIKFGGDHDQTEEASLAPLITGSLLKSGLSPSQYSLLGGVKQAFTFSSPNLENADLEKDPRLFFNIASPSSTFICGSQGSGKSHTLSCILEGCLIPSKAGRLLSPLTAVVFHYDTFICDNGGSPCEAAFLASHSNVKVRVLCAPTNLQTIKKTYARFKINVQPLQIDQSNLNTKRMLDLMAVGQDSGSMPLYMHTVQRILREMRLLQQKNGSGFDYCDFKKRVLSSDLLPGQLEPLSQRLDVLESFMPSHQAEAANGAQGKKRKSTVLGSDWTPKPSQLTIVDLSCPCISPDTASSLFNICFGIFMEQDTKIGRVVALDEAHKYMKNSVEARGFTETLLSTVRLQRHLGARILISTQEPTISSDLLSLCSVTIVHRFSSPSWLRALQGHVAAAALGMQKNEVVSSTNEDESRRAVEGAHFSLIHRIVRLQVGEALLFSTGAALSTTIEGSQSTGLKRLGAGHLVIKIRERLTEDGGRSIISS